MDNICMSSTLLQQFLTVVKTATQIISTFFPATNSSSTIITKILSLARLNDYTYVRFVWISRHKGMFFDPTNMALRYELLDIYLQYSLKDWIYDPLVNTLMVVPPPRPHPPCLDVSGGHSPCLDVSGGHSPRHSPLHSPCLDVSGGHSPLHSPCLDVSGGHSPLHSPLHSPCLDMSGGYV